MVWISRNTKPTADGIYVVAKFNQSNEMEWFCTDWCKLGLYFGPNSANYCGDYDYTHWMRYSDYRKILENTPRE